MTTNQRPGVYSSYDIHSGYVSPRSVQAAALVCEGCLEDDVYTVSSYGEAAETLKGEENRKLFACAVLLLDSGVAKILVSAVAAGEYAPALARVEEMEGVGALVSDAQTAADLQLVKQSVLRSAQSLRERLAFTGVADPKRAAELGDELNCERMVLCCPAVCPPGVEDPLAVYAACALAGEVLARSDPAYNWSGQALRTIERVDRLEEREIQELLRCGVTVLERVGDAVECIRLVTTRTTTDGVEDTTLRPINTILIIDDVMRTIRSALKQRLRGLRMTKQSMESVRSQVTVELAAKEEAGLLESYAAPVVYPHRSDPAVCVVELAFQVAYVAHQIHITAHIQV